MNRAADMASINRTSTKTVLQLTLRMELDDVDPGQNPHTALRMSCIESVHPELPPNHVDDLDDQDRNLRLSVRRCAWSMDQSLLLATKISEISAAAARLKQAAPHDVKLRTKDVFESDVLYQPVDMSDAAVFDALSQNRSVYFL
jgi:hypothetical protein